MKKQGNNYLLTALEKQAIKNLIDEKYGCITTPGDYDSTSYQSGLEGAIANETGERVSGSTLERIVGLRKKEDQQAVRSSKLYAVARYLTFRNEEELLQFIDQDAQFRKRPGKPIETSEIVRKHILAITYGEKRHVNLRLLKDGSFEVTESRNSKLRKSDRIELTQLEIGSQLICSKVFRYQENGRIEMGPFSTGNNNAVDSITLVKP